MAFYNVPYCNFYDFSSGLFVKGFSVDLNFIENESP